MLTDQCKTAELRLRFYSYWTIYQPQWGMDGIDFKSAAEALDWLVLGGIFLVGRKA